MTTTSDGGNQQQRGLRGDPVVDRTTSDGTRDQVLSYDHLLESHHALLAALKECARFFDGNPDWEHADGTPVDVAAIEATIATAESLLTKGARP